MLLPQDLLERGTPDHHRWEVLAMVVMLDGPTKVSVLLATHLVMVERA
jgi:hypothetical protein